MIYDLRNLLRRKNQRIYDVFLDLDLDSEVIESL